MCIVFLLYEEIIIFSDASVTLKNTMTVLERLSLIICSHVEFKTSCFTGRAFINAVVVVSMTIFRHSRFFSIYFGFTPMYFYFAGRFARVPVRCYRRFRQISSHSCQKDIFLFMYVHISTFHRVFNRLNSVFTSYINTLNVLYVCEYYR